MKNLFLAASLLFIGVTAVNAQEMKFGAKVGTNFSNLNGDGVNGDILTSFHVGALVEINLVENFSFQPELLYSAQGTEIANQKLKLDYISIPALAKFYLISEKLSIEAGPQFSFLINDDAPAGSQFEGKAFDFAAVGGVSYNLTSFIFVQARYVAGLTDATKNASVSNRVFQLSAGLRF